MKKYKEIEFEGGHNIESALNELKEHEGLTCGSFNGKMLYSDIDDMDSAYKKITGKTRAEIDTERQKEIDAYKIDEEKHKEAIPELTKEWINKGQKILDDKYHTLWTKCVPVRLSDLYRGMELEACLEIVDELNKGCELETAKDIIMNQGHSGMSFGLVRSMVESFCDRGKEFNDYVK